MEKNEPIQSDSNELVPQDPDLAAFNPSDSAAALIAEARSIQKLLKQYQNNTSLLQKEVGEFIDRDEAEEKQFSNILLDVTKSELELLQNTNYIKYMKKVMDSKEGESLGAEGSKPASIGGSPSQGMPNGSILMADYTGVHEFICGWKTKKSTDARQNLSRMCNDLFSSTASFPKGEHLTIFCNGFPCLLSTPSSDQMVQDLMNLVKLQEQLSNQTKIPMSTKTLTTTRIFLIYQNYCMQLSSYTASSLTEAFFSHSDDKENNSPLNLLGDSADRLTAVKTSRIENSVHFRGFFFAGTLRAVEQLGPEVGVLTEFQHPSLSREEGEEEQKKILTLGFQSLYAELLSQNVDKSPSGTSMALIVAFPVEMLYVARNGEGNPIALRAPVLLDFHPVSPSLPYDWRISWGELCSLGQLHSSKERFASIDPSSAGSKKENEKTDVLFKVTKVQVSSLEPSDSLSKIAFPILNEIMTQKNKPGAQVGDSRATTLAGAVSLALAAVGTAGIFLKKK